MHNRINRFHKHIAKCQNGGMIKTEIPKPALGEYDTMDPVNAKYYRMSDPTDDYSHTLVEQPDIQVAPKPNLKGYIATPEQLAEQRKQASGLISLQRKPQPGGNYHYLSGNTRLSKQDASKRYGKEVYYDRNTGQSTFSKN
ncbi:MAG: hypothetical protein [Circular genetic element sp.]|nr:MAG: hypothetical protein [Circular genetic element sp.]